MFSSYVCIPNSGSDFPADKTLGRELFPTSDCLKAGQREKMLQDELFQPDADILCLQVRPGVWRFLSFSFIHH